MVGENFRSWLEAWGKKGWLTRISKVVDPEFVVGAITKKLEKEKAVFFSAGFGIFHPFGIQFLLLAKCIGHSPGNG